MRSTILLLAILGASVSAHPSFQHRRLHQKRDSVSTTTIGNEVIIEEITDVYVTVPAAAQVPASEPTTTLAVPENLAVEPVAASPSSSAPVVQAKYAHPSSWHHHHHQPSPSPAESSSPVETSVVPVSATPSASPIETSETAASPPSSSSSASEASASPEASETSTPTPSPGTFWSTSPKSPLAGGADSKDVLTQANYWRAKWLNLPPFTWSSTLAKNAYLTATTPTTYTTDANGNKVPHDEGGATVMGHHLYEGSNAQCIISGDDTTIKDGMTPFELAFLGWLCELPNANIPCEAIGAGKGGGETGHADIIKDGYSQIGCYYMDSVGNSGFTGMWTCDFSGK